MHPRLQAIMIADPGSPSYEPPVVSPVPAPNPTLNPTLNPTPNPTFRPNSRKQPCPDPGMIALGRKNNTAQKPRKVATKAPPQVTSTVSIASIASIASTTPTAPTASPPLVAKTTPVAGQPSQPSPRIPASPSHLGNINLLNDNPGIGADEVYSEDEKKLNEFISLHPMLSLEATSVKTVELCTKLFDKLSTNVPELPVIDKTYDDSMLRPSNKSIGERDCVCADKCIVRFLAKWRHGAETDLAFTCTEFLLPAERDKFVAGGGLPPRRKKCLVCTRYFTSYLYYKARLDPNFKLDSSTINSQSFCNSVAVDAASETPANSPDYDELTRAQHETPESVSSVLTTDGYKPSAMLFVDETFASRAVARKSNIAALAWKPVVRFCSSHYAFEATPTGPKLLQVGIGADAHTVAATGGGMQCEPHFRQAPAARVVQQEPVSLR